MTISYIDDSYMTVLNSRYRHKDASTDILSFPEYKVGKEGSGDGIENYGSCKVFCMRNIVLLM